MKIHISRSAREDLEDIWLYSYQHWGARHADLYIDLLVLRFTWLMQNRSLWQERRDLSEGLYCYREKSHVIYFTQSKSSMKIVRLLHKKTDPALHL